MSDTNLLIHRQSEVQVQPEELPRSISEPTLAKPDVVTLYTTPVRDSVSLLLLLLQIVRDILAFLGRVGLSAMMFVIDFLLRLFVFVIENWLHIPGASLLALAFRFVVWCYQSLMWLSYSGLELIFYMPTPFLMFVYIGFLLHLYYHMPAAVDNLLNSMWWLVEHFFNIVAYFAVLIFWKP